MNRITMELNADDLILQALKEDIPFGDISADAVLPQAVKGSVDLISKQSGIIAGLKVFARVFELIDDDIDIEFMVTDGDFVCSGQRLAVLKGDLNSLLSGERTALNYLQHMSGIATYTRSLANLLEGSNIKLLDTRKTTPCNRIFEKYAVRIGGGYNHRFSLSDGVMLKDNHIAAAGGIKKAVETAKSAAPFVRKIEVEVETLDMVKEAIEAEADIIMLDNMDYETMKEALQIIDGKAETECSGNITAENIAQLADLGVNYISSGAITHSAPILDISMKNMHTEEICKV